MTKKFGIIGNPVKHSLSPILHNYWFEKYNIDAHYSIIETSEDNLSDIIKKIKDKSLEGINVTLPYKQKIINLLDKTINDAKLTGSTNTIYLNNKGLIVGENTDVFGLQAGYLKEIDVTNKTALVIGAGGVSPSIILALQKSGIKKISVINRTKEKCLFLKNKFKFINVLSWENLENEIAEYQIVINATSLGLKNSEDFNFNFGKLKNDAVFIDTIYNPLETKICKYLKEKDIKVFNGLDMFIYQGQKSFYLWNKINPEIDDKLISLLKSKLS